MGRRRKKVTNNDQSGDDARDAAVNVEIPESMQRAMAREAEAERERRAKIINARR